MHILVLKTTHEYAYYFILLYTGVCALLIFNINDFNSSVRGSEQETNH